jgi:hypothetical protein
MSEVLPKPYFIRTNQKVFSSDVAPTEAEAKTFGGKVEPWLTALMQAEHLNVLLGSGFSISLANVAKSSAKSMALETLTGAYAAELDAACKKLASAAGRGAPNFEDQIRAMQNLIAGLDVLAAGKGAESKEFKEVEELRTILASLLNAFTEGVLAGESGIREAFEKDDEEASIARRLAAAFVLAFASRTPTRDRLHIFTTNYDRLIEYLADLLGLRVVDRFVGMLEPIFRSSRLGIDIHYDPPGIRGEPRYLEGVMRLTKLHGSLDWRFGSTGTGRPEVYRVPQPFGGAPILGTQGEQILIYPNSAKDWETSDYPYADLFRDFAAAVCRPNAVLFTFGYGFGDDHINRHIRDMLTLSSTHLVIIARSDSGGRISKFLAETCREEQTTILLGKEIVDLPNLIRYYMPKPAIDRHTMRMADLLNRRSPMARPDSSKGGSASSAEADA